VQSRLNKHELSYNGHACGATLAIEIEKALSLNYLMIETELRRNITVLKDLLHIPLVSLFMSYFQHMLSV
jgi:hypothetical protein